MSKSNIEKVFGEIFSDEQRLPEFLACEDQDDLYRYCLEKGSGYTREEFDEFVEETIEKAGEEINQNSLSDGGAKAPFGNKIRQAFTKVLAAGLAAFSVAPVVQNFIPQTRALKTVEQEETQGRGSKKGGVNKNANVEKTLLGVIAVTSVVGNVVLEVLRRDAVKTTKIKFVENIQKFDSNDAVKTKIETFNKLISNDINSMKNVFGPQDAMFINKMRYQIILAK